jgi:myo-inositol-1(or 4)-monophosphatase
MKERNLWERALMFAAKAHDGGYRKGSRMPYIVHPIETSFIVASITDDEEVIAAAALHDVIEDTAVTLEELEREFGTRIAEFVAAESENKRPECPPEETWKIRKQESLLHLQNESKEVKIIALADKLSNMRSTMHEYEKSGDAIWERFNQKDKLEHKWYHTSMLSAMQELQDLDAWNEYRDLIQKIFES